MDVRGDPVRLQVIPQLLAMVCQDDRQMGNGTVPAPDDVEASGGSLLVSIENREATCIGSVEVGQKDGQESRLQFVEPRVATAGCDDPVLVAPSILLKPADGRTAEYIEGRYG